MITVYADKGTLIKSILDIMSNQKEALYSSGLLIRINGVFNSSDSNMVKEWLQSISLRSKVEVFTSAVDEENRMELEIFIKSRI